jgi:hypothetical protein
MAPIILKGWKYAAFIGTIVGAIGITLYPIAIHPMLNSSEYSKCYIIWIICMRWVTFSSVDSQFGSNLPAGAEGAEKNHPCCYSCRFLLVIRVSSRLL